MALVRPVPRSASLRRRHLRLIPGGGNVQPLPARGIRRPGPLFVALSSALILALIFGVVFLNIAAANASFRVEDVRSRVTREEARHRQLRLKIATLESPMMVAEAAGRLGLVVPLESRYLIVRPVQAGSR